MHLQHFGLKHEPLGFNAAKALENPQYAALQQHINRLLQTKGVALLTGPAGVGKTTALRQITQALNPQQYLTLYQPENHFKAFDIYCQLAEALGLEKRHRYSLLWRDIKQHLLHIYEDKKITPIWILDEAQQLPSNFLHELPAFLNFAFDSKMPLAIILVGLPRLASTLAKSAFTAIASRLQFHVQWSAMDDAQVFEQFINNAFSHAGARHSLLSNTAIALIHMASEGRLRYTERIISRSLQIAMDNKQNHLPDDVVQQAIESLRVNG